MMNFVSAAHASSIFIIGFFEPFKTLVYEDVMNHKVGDSVGQNPQTDRETPPKVKNFMQNFEANTDACKEYKEEIIFFEPTIMLFVMVIFMDIPQKSMHHVFMDEPCVKFHYPKSHQKYQYPEQDHTKSN